MAEMLSSISHHFASHPTAQTTRDPLMLAYWERVLNGLVHELYFPDELHDAGLGIFNLVAQAGLPNINSIPESDRLANLRQLFEKLDDGSYSLPAALV